MAWPSSRLASAASASHESTQEVKPGTPYVRTRQVIALDGWGWHSMKFGIPSRVWSNMQYIKPFATYEQSGYGRHWVDQGLRTLRPSSILTQPAGDPFVSYNPRYIQPAGIPAGNVGTLHLETRLNLVKVWGYLNEGTACRHCATSRLRSRSTARSLSCSARRRRCSSCGGTSATRRPKIPASLASDRGLPHAEDSPACAGLSALGQCVGAIRN